MTITDGSLAAAAHPSPRGFDKTAADRLVESHLLVEGPEALRLQKTYLNGQIFHATKQAVWWAMFGPLLEAAVPGVGGVIGFARLAFNFALVTLSPLAGAFVARVPVRQTLLWTTGFRGFIWGVCVPLTWALSWSGAFSTATAFVIMLVLNFLDGCQVALGNCVDIDVGGLDALSRDHNLALDDMVRNNFNATWQGFFDLSFVLVNPLVALAIWRIAADSATAEAGANGVLLVGVGVIFALLSLVSMLFYGKIPPPSAQVGGGEVRVSALCGDVAAGIRIVCRNVPLLTRLVFLGLETALEDALVAVVLAQLVLHSGIYITPGSALSEPFGNFWVVMIIACGKIGAVAAAAYMKDWEPPDEHSASGWRWLFTSVFVGSLFIPLLPFAIYLDSCGARSSAQILPFVAALGFLTFSTAPKIGFQTLLQSLVAEEHAPQVFGFVACLVVAMDGLVILLVSALFSGFCGDQEVCATPDMQNWLVVVSALYVGHGALEMVVGPCLILRDPSPRDPAPRDPAPIF